MTVGLLGFPLPRFNKLQQISSDEGGLFGFALIELTTADPCFLLESPTVRLLLGDPTEKSLEHIEILGVFRVAGDERFDTCRVPRTQGFA